MDEPNDLGWAYIKKRKGHMWAELCYILPFFEPSPTFSEAWKPGRAEMPHGIHGSNDRDDVL